MVRQIKDFSRKDKTTVLLSLGTGGGREAGFYAALLTIGL
jgi:hypothetical protein